MNIGKPAPKNFQSDTRRETESRYGKGEQKYATYYGGQKRSEIPENERDRYSYQMDDASGEYREFDKKLGDFVYKINQAEAKGTPSSSLEIQNLGGGMGGDEPKEDFLDALSKKKRK